MRSNWGRVFYTNLWASVMLTGMTLATEPQVLSSVEWTAGTVAALAVSCAALAPPTVLPRAQARPLRIRRGAALAARGLRAAPAPLRLAAAGALQLAGAAGASRLAVFRF